MVGCGGVNKKFDKKRMNMELWHHPPALGQIMEINIILVKYGIVEIGLGTRTGRQNAEAHQLKNILFL